MKTQSIIIGFFIAVLILYFAWAKFKNQKPQANTDITRPPKEMLQTEQKQNDKLVIVNDISYTDLQSILTGFCNMYNKERYQKENLH